MTRACAVLAGILGIVAAASCSWVRKEAPDAPPTARTMPAASIFTDRAVLHGTVDPNGSEAHAWFEYGTDPALATWMSTPRRRVGSATAPFRFAETILGLEPYSSYYFRAACGNRIGTHRGRIHVFPTGEYYVAVGDSITRAGGGRSYAPILSELLEKTKGYPNTVANRGVDGATSAAGAQSIPFLLSTVPHAKYWLVMYGTNDARLPSPVPSGKGKKPGDRGYEGSYKDSMQKILSAILAEGKTPYIAKVPYATSPSVDVGAIREYNAVIDELVAANGLAADPPDFFAYFQHHRGEMPDGLHPNGAGFESMATLWFRALVR